MTTMIAELYDALLAAGSPENKAPKAAEAMAGYKAYESRFVRIEASITALQRDVAELQRDVAEVKHDVSGLRQELGEVKRDVFLMKWMLGFVLAFQVALFLKLSLQ
jgi:predicted RNase H-like nuclease (RuvC/YqgF family)